MFEFFDFWYFIVCLNDKYFSVKMSGIVFCIRDEVPIYWFIGLSIIKY